MRSMFATTPDLPNRVVYETDAAGNTLEIHQVYIPPFYGDGLPDVNLNGVLFGDVWFDKYLACQPTPRTSPTAR